MGHSKTKPDLGQSYISNVSKSTFSYRTAFILGTVCCSIALLTILGMYIVSITYYGVKPSIQFPDIFFSTPVIMLMLSILAEKSFSYYTTDKLISLRIVMITTLILSLVFILFVVFGCVSAMEEVPHLYNEIRLIYLLAYTFVFSILICIPIYTAISTIYQLTKINEDLVRSILYVSDRFRKEKFRMYLYYCHYCSIAWIVGLFTIAFVQ